MRLSLLTLTLAVALVAPSLRAQPAPVEPVDAAVAEALELRVLGRDAEALALLTRLWDETRSPRVRAQMARAEQALGRWLDAEAHMTEALATDAPWVVARRASLEAERTLMRSHLGRVEVLGIPDGARVRVDGRGPYTAPLAGPLWTAAGTVLLEVEAEGFFAVTRRVVVDAGGVARETLTLLPMPVPAPPPTTPVALAPAASAPRAAPVEVRISPRAVLGVASLASGAAFALGGLAAHIAREVAISAAADHGCGYGPMGELIGPDDCADRVATADVAGTLAVTGYVLGAVFTGVGVALVATASQPRPRVAWSCAPAWGGGACALRF